MDADTCKWYVSVDKTECGNPAVEIIRKIIVRGHPRDLRVPVPVCHEHQSMHNNRFASARVAAKEGK